MKEPKWLRWQKFEDPNFQILLANYQLLRKESKPRFKTKNGIQYLFCLKIFASETG
jgi:hypothetical protein